MGAILGQLQHVVTLLIILSILVVAHEWGHFIVARLFGIRVDDFSIGFGKRLVRLGKRGDTEYNLRMLPLGGFVKIAGMAADEEPLVRAKDKVQDVVRGKGDDPDSHEIPLIAENVEANATDHVPAPDEFGSKPLWQRSLVIFAGPLMSFILGYLVLCLMGWTVGAPTGKALTRIGLVDAGGEGQRVGLRAGDTITSINGVPMTSGRQMINTINDSVGKPLVMTVVRGNKTWTVNVTPREARDENKKLVLYTDVIAPGALGTQIGLQTGDTIAGINDTKIKNAAQAREMLLSQAGKKLDIYVSRPTSDDLVTLHPTLPAKIDPATLPVLNAHTVGVLKISPAPEYKRVGLRESIRQGNELTVRLFAMLGDLIRRHQLQNNTGGIIYMYTATAVADQNGMADRVFLMAQLSISLAIFNLLPIPVLDGGHLLTFFIEWVRRGKKMTEKQQQVFLTFGLALIGVLFIAIMTKDILRVFHHQLPQ